VNTKRFLSGRGMAAAFHGKWIHAPSGAERKAEWERFYNTDLVYLLPRKDTELLLAGHFNCVLNAADSTGHTQHSRILATIVDGFDFRDVWNASRPSLGYTRYTPKSASALDRIYVTRRLFERKQGVSTVHLLCLS